MSMITTTHPVAGFESRPSWVVAVRKDHWGFWSSLGWVVLALTVATVSIVPLSFAYFTLNGLTGIRLDNVGLILEGAVPAAGLALAVQALFGLMDRVLVPRGLRL